LRDEGDVHAPWRGPEERPRGLHPRGDRPTRRTGRPLRARDRGRGAGAGRCAVGDDPAALPLTQPHPGRRPGPGPARRRGELAGAAGPVGMDRVRIATLSLNYRTPSEIMAEAAP